ncbi:MULTISPECIES: hypothetical protein [Thermoactinomyces]|jgi:hypothetical protein|uniref:Uncharacterized protein n=1 Tax=Thermoactinomyces daqus TaxID=1329516 RepID=A0A7W2AGZ7_9BACL|nr:MULTISPECIES: hypothetical protein [Thermoactinomyces]MBA4541303.1 hypothetical protein [Thermoactinomyces daqus]MBH8596776.1 hypothetical protein [Thermoactinomyces sp. CICC 10523]MBH8603537.1 hypothetical protein [Thermoactinomyces sp. CICC 10522]MBH8606701.1 hypothetical protein [Thermoactinomyces sp. CICC 10521]
MPCTNRNLLKNGNFRSGIFPWTGTGIKWVKNPFQEGDVSVLMKGSATNHAVLKQTIPGEFEEECSYYLNFRVLNVTSGGGEAILYAAVSYLDGRKNLIRTTPLLIEPPAGSSSWYSYFSIVPPPPAKTRFATVVFLLAKGELLVDYIRFASHSIS